jgi:hypothetical protein
MELSQQEQIRFLLPAPDIGALNATLSYQVDLETIRARYGNNFNTLNITNNADEEISITMDGIKNQYIKGSGGVFSFDWQDGITFSTLLITNENAATNTSANEIRISVGRTGLKV